MVLRVVDELPGYSGKSRDDVRGEGVEGSMVLTDRVYGQVPTVDRFLTWQETRAGQRQNVYAEKHGNMLELTTEKLTANVRMLFNIGPEKRRYADSAWR